MVNSIYKSAFLVIVLVFYSPCIKLCTFYNKFKICSNVSTYIVHSSHTICVDHEIVVLLRSTSYQSFYLLKFPLSEFVSSSSGFV